MFKLIIFSAITMTIWATGTSASAQTDANLTFFETKIRPALVEHCFKCHSAKGVHPETDLRLDRKLTDDLSLIVRDLPFADDPGPHELSGPFLSE